MEPFSALLALCAGDSPATGEFPHKGQWRGVLMFSLICASINGWVNNREAGDLRPHRTHYDVTVTKQERLWGTYIEFWTTWPLRHFQITGFFSKGSIVDKSTLFKEMVWRWMIDRLLLTHWGRVHICVGNLTTIGSDNGLSPGRRQAITWTNAGILSIGPLRTNFSEILAEIIIFSFKKMYWKVSSVKWRPLCLGLNVLNDRCMGMCYHISKCIPCISIE